MTTNSSVHAELTGLADRAVTTARRWTIQATKYPQDRAAALLGDVLKHPGGLDFTVAFVDGVIRPEDLDVAAANLAELASSNPTFIPRYLRLPMRLGGAFAKALPRIVVPVARRVFASMVGDLVVDVSDAKLGKALARLKAGGARLNVNLLGEAVLGDDHATTRLNETLKLLRRDDVDYVSLKVSAVVGPHNPWAFDETVDHAVGKLRPLYEYAASARERKFINLDMEEYHDLHLTIAVFKRLLGEPALKGLEAGIVLQAYLPDALAAMQDLQQWAAERVAAGGAPIKVRIVKGANLAMERVQSTIRDWPLPICDSKQASDANYLRVLDYALRPEHTAHVRIGAASHNLFTQAMVWELAGERGVRDDVELEMLSGMATQQAAAITRDVGELLLYVPVVHRDEYDVAIAYLVRRLEENAAPENFMSAIFDLADDESLFEREKQRFLASVDQLLAEGLEPPAPNRTQDRASETADDLAQPLRVGDRWHFDNVPDTDAALPANLAWGATVRQLMADDTLGTDIVDAHRVTTTEALDDVVNRGVQAGRAWQARPLAERVDILHRVGVELGLMRADLLAVAGNEVGKPLDQSDPEVSEAIDFAHYYAEQAEPLYEMPGAVFTPATLTVVTPPWNFPIAIPLGGVLAALAAGSAVILKPATPTRRCGALIAEACWRAGVPTEVLQLVNLADHELGHQLITDTRVDVVVLTGSAETAEMFRSWRPDLHLMAETSGKNAIIVTPSADLDLAVADVVTSAFGHAGQKCSAASLVICVGSVAESRRFRHQLVDAVRSLHVAWPTDPATQMSPLTEKPGDKLLRGLTTLEPGQRWAVQPRRLDDTDRLWSPGVRIGVAPGSEFHLVEYFGPILGVMTAPTLEAAVELQNATAFGLTGGLHSLNSEEIDYWLNHVSVGNAYVNRSITGAIVRRQPFGGWKQSAVGTGTKAGGPNYLFGFGTFAFEPVATSLPHPAKTQLLALAKVGREVLSGSDQHRLAAAIALDEQAARTEFDVMHDPTQLGVERNVLRYQPLDVTVRVSEGVPVLHVLREASAALAAGEFEQTSDGLRRAMAGNPDCRATVSFSIAEPLPDAVVELLERYGCPVRVQSDAEFAQWAASADWQHDGRIRLLGGDASALARALKGSIDVAVFASDVVTAGRVAMLTYLHEQALSMTNHRFGNRTPVLDGVLGR